MRVKFFNENFQDFIKSAYKIFSGHIKLLFVVFIFNLENVGKMSH